MQAQQRYCTSTARFVSTALLTTMCAIPLTMQAAFLYWAKTSVHTKSLQECMSFADHAMRNLNYQHVRVSRDEIAGDGPGVYSVITCIGTNPVTAVVMVVGENGTATSSARDELRLEIAGIIRFDDNQ
jgi:hypothetical protein